MGNKNITRSTTEENQPMWGLTIKKKKKMKAQKPGYLVRTATGGEKGFMTGVGLMIGDFRIKLQVSRGKVKTGSEQNRGSHLAS